MIPAIVPTAFVPEALAYHTATTAWEAQVGAANVSAARKILVNSLIAGLVADGVWPAMDRLWLFAAENAASALVDLVAAATAVSSGATPPAFATDVGYTGNGTSGYIETNYNASTAGGQFSQNSAHFFGWSNTTGTDAGGLCGYNGASPNVRIFTQFTDNQCDWDLNAGNVGFAHTSVKGLYLINRTSANISQLTVNKIVFSNSALASSALQNLTFAALRANGGSTFSTKQICAFGFGGGLNLDQRNCLYNRLRTYMTAVGVP